MEGAKAAGDGESLKRQVDMRPFLTGKGSVSHHRDGAKGEALFLYITEGMSHGAGLPCHSSATGS